MTARYHLLSAACVLFCTVTSEAPATPDIGQCAAPATPISQIQGPDEIPNFLNDNVVIEGVVTGDYQNDTQTKSADLFQLNGFYVQEESTDQDTDETTSEGIFVFEGGKTRTDVSEGDLVRIRGTVTNAYGQTQLRRPTIKRCNSGVSIAATPMRLPLPDSFDLESVEGMLVRFDQPLTVSDTRRLVEFGELRLSSGRLPVPTSVVRPGKAARAQAAANRSNQIILDDGRDDRNNLPFAHGLSASKPVRTGETISGLTAILGYGFDHYRLRPTQQGFEFDDTNPRPRAPFARRGTLRIAAFNSQNFFSSIDRGKSNCGPEKERCRGADSAEELSRQLSKLAAAINLVDADIVGLIELENNAAASLEMLTDALNRSTPSAERYIYLNTGTLGRDVIKVGFLYRPARVALRGRWAVLDSDAARSYDSNLNRPMLAQTFVHREGALTIALGHWKSKSCSSAKDANANQNDGQACYNPVRTAAARAAAKWLLSDPTGSGDSDFMIMGDLNAYALETPITTLLDAGFTDLVRQHTGPLSYSYVYRGEAGYLDHALANASLADQVDHAGFFPINADELRVYDFNEERLNDDLSKPADFLTNSAFRSSDHDPVIVDVTLRASIHADDFE